MREKKIRPNYIVPSTVARGEHKNSDRQDTFLHRERDEYREGFPVELDAASQQSRKPSNCRCAKVFESVSFNVLRSI